LVQHEQCQWRQKRAIRGLKRAPVHDLKYGVGFSSFMQPKTLRARPGQRCSPAKFRLIRPRIVLLVGAEAASCRSTCGNYTTQAQNQKGVRSGNPSLLGSIRAGFRICRPLAGCFAGLDRGTKEKSAHPRSRRRAIRLLVTAKQLVRRGMLLGGPPLANFAPVAVPSRLSAPRHQTTLARPEPLRSTQCNQ
jgi:hypothetical protein